MREPVYKVEKFTDIKDMLKNQEKNMEKDQHTYLGQMFQKNSEK